MRHPPDKPEIELTLKGGKRVLVRPRRSDPSSVDVVGDTGPVTPEEMIEVGRKLSAMIPKTLFVYNMGVGGYGEGFEKWWAGMLADVAPRLGPHAEYVRRISKRAWIDSRITLKQPTGGPAEHDPNGEGHTLDGGDGG
jgi:hypothetical protein